MTRADAAELRRLHEAVSEGAHGMGRNRADVSPTEWGKMYHTWMDAERAFEAKLQSLTEDKP